MDTTLPSRLPDGVPPRFLALIPCAGTGSRAGTSRPKQYEPVAGVPLVRHTLRAFSAVARIARTVMVVAPADDFPAGSAGEGCVTVKNGGASRAETVLNGLNALAQMGADAHDWVLVHDAARCLVTPAQINALIDACQHDATGGLLALPLADTLKQAAGGRVTATLERADKWLAQTPQMFRLGALKAALSAAAESGAGPVTDEAGAMEAAGHAPLLVAGSAQNFKVTYPEDFALAEAILRSRQMRTPT